VRFCFFGDFAHWVELESTFVEIPFKSSKSFIVGCSLPDLLLSFFLSIIITAEFDNNNDNFKALDNKKRGDKCCKEPDTKIFLGRHDVL